MKQTKPMSAISLVTLKYIATHEVSLDFLPAFRMMTIYSLYYRDLIVYRVNGLAVTSAGKAVLKQFGGEANIWRKEQKTISNRIARILRRQAGIHVIKAKGRKAA